MPMQCCAASITVRTPTVPCITSTRMIAASSSAGPTAVRPRVASTSRCTISFMAGDGSARILGRISTISSRSKPPSTGTSMRASSCRARNTCSTAATSSRGTRDAPVTAPVVAARSTRSVMMISRRSTSVSAPNVKLLMYSSRPGEDGPIARVMPVITERSVFCSTSGAATYILPNSCSSCGLRAHSAINSSIGRASASSLTKAGTAASALGAASAGTSRMLLSANSSICSATRCGVCQRLLTTIASARICRSSSTLNDSSSCKYAARRAGRKSITSRRVANAARALAGVLHATRSISNIASLSRGTSRYARVNALSAGSTVDSTVSTKRARLAS
eukprot:Unigene9279_Nuclearia_a/m.28337 Unigene9279_Nuclearia_a/g.28337  ORF Unigene9279_Nuclearia_a/g.28337 Unigene9279_Nuclearia_a/m.28337 type:complete len:335 (+) Unigene9279_Nuclearia_a:184-1188(+)